MSIQKILLAYDFSDYSTQALDGAIALAQKLNATLELIHVLPYDQVKQLVQLVPHLDQVEDRIRENVEKEFEKVLGAHSASIETHIEVGKPEQEIVQFAEEGKYDLLILGTHGRGGISHFFLGSVSERVLRHAKLPVLVSRGETPADIRHILVPVDRSPASGAALRQAKEWADRFGAKITVMHVLGEYYYLPLYMQADMAAYGGLVGDYENQEKELIEQWLKEMGIPGANSTVIDVTFVNGADAANTIIETARDSKSTLIVMGTHGHKGLEHLVLGSVAEKVVRYAPCSVLTVHG